MFTITVPRADVSSEEVSEALRSRLGAAYHVQPGVQMRQISFVKPQPGQPDAILVSTGSDRTWRAQVRIVRRSGQTQIQVTPGGVAGPLLVNTFGIARKVRRVLLDATELGAAH